MSIEIRRIQPTDTPAWDTYVHSHPRATLYHLSGWKNVIEKTYSHKACYLMAVEEGSSFRRRRIFTPCNACPVKCEAYLTGAEPI